MARSRREGTGGSGARLVVHHGPVDWTDSEPVQDADRAGVVMVGPRTTFAPPPDEFVEADSGATTGEARLSLTSLAPDLIRVHAARDLVRVSTLLVADAVALLVVLLATHRLLALETLPAAQLLLPVLIGLAVTGCYGAGDRRRDAGALAQAAALGTGLGLWSVLWSRPLPGALAALLGLWLAATIALTAERKLVDLLVRMARPEQDRVMRAAVVGPSGFAPMVIDHPAFGEDVWCYLAAFFDPERHGDDPGPALGRLIRERRIDTVILAGRLSQDMFATALEVATASGCHVFSLPRVPPSSTLLPRVVWRSGYPVVELTRPGLLGTKLLIKRSLDLVLSAAALVALAPVLGLIALAIRLRSPGPILFRQTRIGQGGRPFTIFKFRTMVLDAESRLDDLRRESVYPDERLFKVEQDPRVTPVGAFLRRTSLDELPQLWNVLRGDMSLVGPRPPLPSEVALYQGHHYARFDVKPGITGPWQVSGRNSIRDFENVVRLETAYIRRWTLWLDLKLLLRTVPVVLSRRGAY